MAQKRTLVIEVDFHFSRGFNTKRAADAQHKAWERVLRALRAIERGTCITLDEVRTRRLDDTCTDDFEIVYP